MGYNFEKFPQVLRCNRKIKSNQKDIETNRKSIKYLTS